MAGSMKPTELLEAWMENVWNRRDTQFIHDHMANPCEIDGLPESAQTPEGFAAFRSGAVNEGDIDSEFAGKAPYGWTGV